MERDGAGVAAGVDELGDAAVGAVGADDDVDGERSFRVGRGGGVVDDVRLRFGGGDVESGDEGRDEDGAGGLRARAEERIEDFAAEHGDGLVGLEGFGAEVDGEIGGGDDLRAGDMAVDEVEGDRELVQHAKRDGSAAGLGGVGAALEEECLDAGSCKDLCGGGSGGTAADDGGA